MASLQARHIQDFANAAGLEPHWGYADRVVPCTNDAGSCAYLDVVYHSHDLGMLYVGIIWATIGSILLIWFMTRRSTVAARISQSQKQELTPGSENPRNSLQRFFGAARSLTRHWLLPESFRPVFGRATRLQVVILLVLIGYLTVWSFVGIVYSKWITPVKNSTLFNTRTSLGPFADRIGLLAYALMPFSIMLSSRESILSLLTGIPYQHFNFLHRWLGYIIFAQSIVHTVGWTVIETVLYQPQPKVGADWIKQNYMIWGVVAQIFVTLIFVASLPPVIRLTGYEFFRKSHYVVAMLFVGACWAHWEPLSCFMIAALAVWFLDRGARIVRTGLLHYNYLPNGKMGFANALAKISFFPDQKNGDVVRLDFEHPQEAWKVGQHFYLCFPQLSVWQSHPFTPLSASQSGGSQKHTYVLRSKLGETRNLARLAATKTSLQAVSGVDGDKTPPAATATTSVILTGPYGEDVLSHTNTQTNILCVAGGTGITYVMPVLLSLAQQEKHSINRKLELIWAICMENDTKWVQPELDRLEQAAKGMNLTIRIFVTRECCTTSAAVSDAAIAARKSDLKVVEQITEKVVISSSSSSSSSSGSVASSSVGKTGDDSSSSNNTVRSSARPDLNSLTASFVETTITGPTTVFASGPATMISDLRTAVSKCNDPSKVWKGQERFDVALVCDDRLEW